VRALPTTYKNYKMRSRLECRWACFWDALGVAWEYERDAFDLGDVRYLPDFWLPEFKVWVEIKGEIRDDGAGLRMIMQCSQLAAQDRHPVILCFHDPFNPLCAVFTHQGMYPESRWTYCRVCGALALGVRSGTFSLVWCPRKHEREPLRLAALKEARNALTAAAVAARQRQFGISRNVRPK
jgi:hypothetical protein